MSDALLPYAVGAAKRARRVAVRMRRRVERLHTAPAFGGGIPPRPALRPLHLSVLGGRTLNVALLVPPTTAVASARLELARGGRTHRLPLELEPQSDGTRLLTATTALRFTDAPDGDSASDPGLALTAGLWRVATVLTGPDGQETRTGVAAVALPATDGPVAPVSPDPAGGAHFRLMRSVDGFAVLKVRAPAHQAELDTFALRWDRITVRGRVVAPQAPPAAYTAQAVRRGGGAVLRAPLEWDGDRFAFDLPLAGMVSGRRAHRWDIQLQQGRTGLKIGRRLTDLRRRDQVIRTSFRIIALEDGSLLRVHAYITSAGALAVSCVGFEGAPDGAEERV
ncbi:hypothetical protein [Streptomyces sp. NRRL F-5727]|uniref:hypothetical protein n=1 Tax=Streptomyces sp. NRRL F-5727 TaxID=1463871 RepID=UPI00131CB0E6|nr:hypothetical protein [Streptomyces sp. NRRL F-5727]